MQEFVALAQGANDGQLPAVMASHVVSGRFRG
jgi:hypothetical protein